MRELNRRDFLMALKAVSTASVASASSAALACIARPLPVQSPYASAIPDRETDTLVNDVHSQLNATLVGAIAKPRDVAEVRAAIAGARAAGRAISVAGGRHAMGGQQFGEGHLLVDMRDMNRVLAFDADNGSITVEGGIQWPALLDHLNRAQEGRDRQWGIYQNNDLPAGTFVQLVSLGGAFRNATMKVIEAIFIPSL